MVGVAARAGRRLQSSSAWRSRTVAEADLGAGSANDVGGRCCVRNRYTGRRAVNTPLRDWLA
jgi:hypothetical protein